MELRTPGAADEAAAVPVAPGVMRITLPLPFTTPDHIHCYLLDIDGWDGPLLVDTGMRGSEAALASCLQDAGGPPAGVLVTHSHVDHWGLAATLTDEVYGHEALAALLAMDLDSGVFGEHDHGVLSAETVATAFHLFRKMTVGQPRVRPVEDGDVLGEWRIVWTPGHDPAHISLFRDRDGVLISGDALLPDATPNIQPAAGREDSLADYLATLARLSALPVSLVLPSHGEPYTDHRGRAGELTAFHAKRLRTILHELRHGPLAVGDLARTLFVVRESAIDDMLADMETLAHLDNLRLKGLVLRRPDHRWCLPDHP